MWWWTGKGEEQYGTKGGRWGLETEGGERIAGMVVGWRCDAAEEERERGEIGRGREER